MKGESWEHKKGEWNHNTTSGIVANFLYMDGECLCPDDEKEVVEKLLAYHPRSDDKIGCGLASIMGNQDRGELPERFGQLDCQAGAKHVYAVEASEMAEYARKLIAGNPSLGQRDNGKVEEVELPEKARAGPVRGVDRSSGLFGGLEMLNRQQMLQVMVNSTAVQDLLYKNECCVFSEEQVAELRQRTGKGRLLLMFLLGSTSSALN